MSSTVRRFIVLTLLTLYAGCAKHSSTPSAPEHAREAPAPTHEEKSPPAIPPANKDTYLDSKPPPLPQSEESMKVGSPAREEVKRRLWGSPLGQMFSSFIFKPYANEKEVINAHSIVDRVFSEVTLTLTRVSALQLMIEDLYERQLMTPIIHDRITLLDEVIALKRHSEEANATNELFRQLPAFIVVGLAGGSPLARGQTTALARGVFHKMLSWIGIAGAAQRSRTAFTELNMLRLFSSDLLEGYQVTRAASTFIQTFGAYSVIFFRMRSGTVDNASIQEKIWIYGMQNVVDLDNL